jgi:HAD superfamily phosphoserine phosphatase-like hydrolase
MRDLCVFDLDGTLVAHDSFGEIVRSNLGSHPVLAAAAIARKAGVISRARFAAMAHQRLVSPLSGVELRDIADEVVGKIIPVRRDVIENWRGKGAFLTLMSASPHEYVSMVGTALGFDGSYGSKFEGTRYRHLHGAEKLELLDREFPAAKWRRVFAMSDSDSDAALLAVFESSQMV